jgi:hypothetical protein
MDYLVVLFKNKEKRKIINKFKTKKKAFEFYNKLLTESTDVVFEKTTESGSNVSFELGLLEKKGFSNEKVFIKDELGRTIKIETDSDDYNILKMNHYKLNEEFVDYSTKSKITTEVFQKKYLKKPGVKLISKLNNKIILQNDEDINLFTFKSEDDSERFLVNMESYFLSIKRLDCIFVNDYSFPQKKYLYNLLIERGFPKSYLQRYSTTHLVKK